jgi:hypothetical protein
MREQAGEEETDIALTLDVPIALWQLEPLIFPSRIG